MSSVAISHKTNQLVLPYDPRVTAVIPHNKVVEKNDKRFQIVPFRLAEVKVLRNFGYNIEAPIESQYDWCNTTPYHHQITTAALLSTNFRAYVINGLGSGKTRSALFASDFLMRTGEARKAVVVAPLSTLTLTWEREIFNVMPHRTAAVIHGTKKQRVAALNSDVDFYIINTDGIVVMIDELKARSDIDIFIIDELPYFRNSKTRRWKALNSLIKNRKWAWGMTGLVAPNGPTDAWGQTKLLTPERTPKYFKQFQQQVEYQITQFKWIPRPEANDVIGKMMQPAVRFATEDCIDLPPTTYITREAALNKLQAKAYKEMLSLFYTEYKGQEINAANAGVKVSKLAQISCGFAYSAEGGYVDFGIENKMSVVNEVIFETPQKVIIFAPFKYTVDRVYEQLSKLYVTGKVYGDTSKTARDRIFTEFRTNPDMKALVAHPGCMSHGVTLVEATTIIWFAPITSYEIYEQACARIVRPGQLHHTNIVHIESSPIERLMFKKLQNKQSASNVLLGLFSAMTKREGKK
jgi:SNF2 family DNA or RNA helicase